MSEIQTDLEFKDYIYEQFSRICKSLASARRFELLDLLSQGEHTVEELANEFGMSTANTSQHLQHLRSSRLVEVRRRGTEMQYRLADETVIQLLHAIQGLAEARLAEIDRIIDHFQKARQAFDLIGLEELNDMIMNSGETIEVLDVRPESEFLASHIPGARFIALDQLPQCLGEIPKDRRVIVYCRSYYSSLSDRAVRLLREKGYNVSRIDQGFAEWREAGFPVERGLQADSF